MIGRKPDIEKILIFEMHCEMRAAGSGQRAAENSKSPYAVLAQGEEREFAIRYENEGLE